MKNIFITGTDTGVGKTVATAALVSILRGNGVCAVPMKPVQTGCSCIDGTWAVPDLAFVLTAARIQATEEEQKSMCPYRFELPCSPHLAAENAQSVITLDKILASYRDLEKTNDMILVEGAGGILVPVDETKYMRDIMTMLDIPVILVSRTGLGTLNHTLLSINELKRVGLTVAGVIFCETEFTEDTYIVQDNKRTIARLGEVAVLGTLPFLPDIDQVITSPESFYQYSMANLPDILTHLKEL